MEDCSKWIFIQEVGCGGSKLFSLVNKCTCITKHLFLMSPTCFSAIKGFRCHTEVHLTFILSEFGIIVLNNSSLTDPRKVVKSCHH